ncbi:hypothetical protein IJJ12_00205, partial [bacterium]|nr:hypothetical protein [bacterium]
PTAPAKKKRRRRHKKAASVPVTPDVSEQHDGHTHSYRFSPLTTTKPITPDEAAAPTPETDDQAATSTSATKNNEKDSQPVTSDASAEPPDQDKKQDKSESTAADSTAVNTTATISLQEIQKAQRRRNWLIVAVLIIVGILLFLWLRARHGGKSELEQLNERPSATAPGQTASLDGYILTDGYQFASAASDRVAIYLRAENDSDFQDTGIRLVPGESAWHYTQATSDTTYQIQAGVISAGQIVAVSNVVTATAPQNNLNLIFGDPTNPNLAPTTTTSFTTGALTGASTSLPDVVASQRISGTVTISGLIPQGSTLTIWVGENRTNQSQTQQTAFNFDATDRTIPYQINHVTPGVTYIIDAMLQGSDGQSLGAASQTILAGSGVTDANFTIQSQAAPASVRTVHDLPSTANRRGQGLSGQVSLSGAMRDGSSIQILGRPAGSGDWSVWQTIDPVTGDDVNWYYGGAATDQTYEVQAALLVGGQRVSYSKSKTITAPGRTSFNLETKYELADLGQDYQVRVEPCTRTGDTWETYVVIPGISGARQYWLEVTGQHTYADERVSANGGQEVRVPVRGLPGGVDLRAHVRYATCSGCTDSANFSSWSKRVTFSCQ